MSVDFNKLASELPTNLQSALRAGRYSDVASKVAGLYEPSAPAIYEKIGKDLMQRLLENRRINSGLGHLRSLGASHD